MKTCLINQWKLVLKGEKTSLKFCYLTPGVSPGGICDEVANSRWLDKRQTREVFPTPLLPIIANLYLTWMKDGGILGF